VAPPSPHRRLPRLHEAGVLLRPATVAQIEATAHRRERMPPKTTYFHPKIRTGLLFRSAGG